MKSIKFAPWGRRFATFLVGVALATTMFGFETPVANPTPHTEQIASKMAALQNTNQRWIEINLSNQRLIAWEGGEQVYAVIVSTGKQATPTRTGVFNIQTKLRRDRMRGPGYDISNVPYTMYYQGGYAIHGAYWHNNFGTRMSHGCVNVAVDHAEWLYNWASVGTPVVIHQ
ncbi:ErfK/YbiS/YcfS/YnhG family [Coleofasciculus chthonoplastes PCC 7420]|uniref:ErfK/YbiS/YcfS/YnhG family n=1 Tax=Coleofasciculus chthonoplastes PCC 7420 TaxID=118168 RepID=B4VSZ3_9CYAN|nr:L,D-transpeptidase [Coleofasciculus chthonoplastes]EDX74900.1 ErfK/YbiS/YcfS/YnhG family [Coleofasciculus chthonoplastes PCC 7420]